MENFPSREDVAVNALADCGSRARTEAPSTTTPTGSTTKPDRIPVCAEAGMPNRQAAITNRIVRPPSRGARKLLGRYMNQRAGIGVFDQPQRAIRRLRHVANSLAHGPA